MSTDPAPASKKRKVNEIADDAEPIVDDKIWTTGDFALVSSDNVRFRVDLVHLLSASSVFRDMSSVATDCADRELHLTDDTIESSLVIQRFLPLLIDAEVDVDDIHVHLCHLVHLAQLLVKYDCRFLKIVLGLRVKDTISTHCSGVYTFIIAAIMDDSNLCVESMSNPMLLWAPPTAPPNAMINLSYMHCFNPQSFSFEWWSFIPEKYLWALTRSWVLASNDLSTLPRQFKTILAEAKAVKL